MLVLLPPGIEQRRRHIAPGLIELGRLLQVLGETGIGVGEFQELKPQPDVLSPRLDLPVSLRHSWDALSNIDDASSLDVRIP